MHLELLVSIKQAFFWEDGNLIGNSVCKYVKKKKIYGGRNSTGKHQTELIVFTKILVLSDPPLPTISQSKVKKGGRGEQPFPT